MKKLKALSICKDDKGHYIHPPAEFEVSDERAALLIEAGSAESAGKKKESGSKDAASGSGEGGELSQEQRNDKIRKELETMLAEDPKQENNLLWTQAGDPRNKTLDQRCGFNVKNEEVTPIWAELKPKGEE